MTITYRPGTKGPGDQRVFWNGEQVTFIDVAEIVRVLCNNEDIIYPPSKGFKGGQMLIDFLQEVYNHDGVTNDLLKQYKLGEHRPGKDDGVCEKQ